jgi:hypothetical protein
VLQTNHRLVLSEITNLFNLFLVLAQCLAKAKTKAKVTVTKLPIEMLCILEHTEVVLIGSLPLRV